MSRQSPELVPGRGDSGREGLLGDGTHGASLVDSTRGQACLSPEPRQKETVEGNYGCILWGRQSGVVMSNSGNLYPALQKIT